MAGAAAIILILTGGQLPLWEGIERVFLITKHSQAPLHWSLYEILSNRKEGWLNCLILGFNISSVLQK